MDPCTVECTDHITENHRRVSSCGEKLICNSLTHLDSSLRFIFILFFNSVTRKKKGAPMGSRVRGGTGDFDDCNSDVSEI